MEKIYNRIFYLFIALHVVVWTMLPTLLRHTLPMDAIEGFVWGQNLTLGYDRNPWLNAWLTRLAVDVGGHSGWLVYFLSQVSVALCFWAVWRLGKKIMHPIYALVAVLILEGIQYYTLASVDFNDNVLELGLWALTILCFYNALKAQRYRDWILTGIFAGLSLMAKYYAVMLFVPMIVFMLITAEGRASFRRGGFYLGLIIFGLIVLPHFIWMFLSNDFSTWNYALHRVDAVYSWRNCSYCFLATQILIFLGAVLLFLVLLPGKVRGAVLSARTDIKRYDKNFLLILGLGPCLLTFFVAVVFRMTMHSMWGTPLLSLWGLVLLAWTQPTIDRAKLYRFLAAVFLVFCAWAVGYSYGIMFKGYGSSANYPAVDISRAIFSEWNSAVPHPPKYVVGDRYVAGNLVYFVKQPQPKVFILDETTLDKIDAKKIDAFRKEGAILIWWNYDTNKKYALSLLTKLSKQEQMQVQNKEFYWLHNGVKAVANIGFVFLR